MVVVGQFGPQAVDFGGGAITGAGSQDVFVAKYSAAGTHLWSRGFGGTGGDVAYSVAIDKNSGDVVVTGSFQNTVTFGGGPLTSAGQGDIFIAKYSGATGAHLWSKRFGSIMADQGTDVAVDSSGNIVLTGLFTGAVDFGTGPLAPVYDTVGNVFVAKFSASGTALWAKNFAENGAGNANGLAIDASGNIVVVGSFQGNIDFGGGWLVSANGYFEAFVAKFSPAGVYQWAKSFGYAYNSEEADAVTTDSSGNVVVAGTFPVTINFGGGTLTAVSGNEVFLVSFSAAGAHRWSKSFGVSPGYYGTPYGLAVDASDNVIMTGSFEGTANFGGGSLTTGLFSDIFVAKYTNAGTHLWSQMLGGTGSACGRGVVVDGSGNTVLTGAFANTVYFGGGPLTSAGSFDIFLLRLAP
jgi:hypothetical protein